MATMTLEDVLIPAPTARAEVPALHEGVRLQDVSVAMMLRQLAAGRDGGERTKQGLELNAIIHLQERNNGDGFI